jgi:hypothetical protein
MFLLQAGNGEGASCQEEQHNAEAAITEGATTSAASDTLAAATAAAGARVGPPPPHPAAMYDPFADADAQVGQMLVSVLCLHMKDVLCS